MTWSATSRPAGRRVPGNPDRTLVNALIAHCGETLPGSAASGPSGIVHRLDKDTTGIMVVAKTDPALQHLSRHFAGRRVGAPSTPPWSGACPTRRPSSRGDRPRPARPQAHGGGRAGGPASPPRRSMPCGRPRGGRPWSCRLARLAAPIRSASISPRSGHPLVGDPTYGRGLRPGAAAPPGGPGRGARLRRQALHAAAASGAVTRVASTPAPAGPSPRFLRIEIRLQRTPLYLTALVSYSAPQHWGPCGMGG